MAEVPPINDPALKGQYFLAGLAKSILTGRSVKVVAIGSGDTAGQGGVLPYPARLQVALSREFTEIEFDVINSGVEGEEAPEELKRFDRDVISHAPALVIWQVGTDAIVKGHSSNEVIAAVRKGVEWIEARALDTILMGPPYVPALISSEKISQTQTMQSLISQIASEKRITVFNRFEIMRSWQYDHYIPLEQMVDPNDLEKLHLSDWATGQIADDLTDYIIDGIKGVENIYVPRATTQAGEAVNKSTDSHAQEQVAKSGKNDEGATYLDQPGSYEPPWVDDSAASRVTLLYATTRRRSNDEAKFSSEREPERTAYGIASVKAPRERLPGKPGRPTRWTAFNVTLYEGELDPRYHFVLEDFRALEKEHWLDLIAKSSSSEVLIFVHGFNVSFLDGLYMCSQVAWDIRYRGLPILFSWASAASLSLTGYMYDRESALLARDRFVELLLDLRSAGVSKLNIMAHSMGNFLVLDALQNYANRQSGLALENLMMAAPDVDAEQYQRWIEKIGPLARGMTMYASSRDKALKVSKKLARGVRAGDVPIEGPLVVHPVETIDASDVGRDILGTNHGIFASKTSILNDIKFLLQGVPAPRLVEISGMPIGAKPSKWWRYVG
ncbi:alpha/beta hydrolase [Bradyrhizobium guangdongense]|uniref:Alpha/beta hydrolase n=1 Tax=Bradyrhizobium guangdongense TaxID=1325090 RepID=A0A410VEW4_9BRAD|nr:alpha/beta hydrolase [Bradyrhizobium guangdongense]QAU42202.1 hypothetical protein X265_34380 [Bradyrhizobium guangdongense]QOZ63261.1 hypothetical protein XH86_34420 [Bradyrhizobium guangdongense]GGI29844.1 hypothetical protein GCM10010987_56490 [Bradyrhizobium guangdongense]